MSDTFNEESAPRKEDPKQAARALLKDDPEFALALADEILNAAEKDSEDHPATDESSMNDMPMNAPKQRGYSTSNYIRL